MSSGHRRRTGVASGAERAVVEAFGGAFPGRVRAYYVSGSRADGSAVRTSDIDLTVVFETTTTPDEERRAAVLSERLGSESSVELDIEVTDEERVFRNAPPWLVLGSRHIAGEDVRDRMRLTPIEEWTRDRMHTSYWRLVTLFERRLPITPPVAAPDPDEPYLGYLRRTVRLLDGNDARSTRDLIRHAGWMATALVAFRAGEYVSTKRECHTAYGQLIGDEWSGLLGDIYDGCRGEWDCLLPQGSEDKRRLRSVCERVLDFENHFLRSYVEFVGSELRSPGDRRAHALRVLNRLPLSYPALSAALRSGAASKAAGNRDYSNGR